MFPLKFKDILKNIISKNKILNKAYNYNHPNKKYSLDLIIDEIIYVLKTGISWRNLRSSINWNTLFHHYRRFVKYNIFKKLFNHMRKKYTVKNKSQIHIIDSSFIQNKYGRNYVARNKFFKNKKCTKISLITDINGIPLSLLFNKGTVHDLSFIEKHINDCYYSKKTNDNTYLLADKAYESKKHRKLLQEHKYQLIVPKKKNAKVKYYFDPIMYKKRILIEIAFGRLKAFRRIMIRYDAYLSSYKGFVQLGASMLIYNKYIH